MKFGLHRYLRGCSRQGITVLAVLLVGLLGLVDSWTGYELSFSIFYLIPVAIASWYAGRTLGMAVSLLAAVMWLVADMAAGHPYSSAWIPYWNACVRLGFFVIVTQLMVRLHELLDAISLLADTDSLTRLFNARTIKRRYEEAAELARRHQQMLAIGFVDIDDFKAINDSLGHQQGDQVLIAVSAKLKERARISDTVGRLGGDEFVVMLPQTDRQGAEVFFNGLHAGLVEMAAARRWPIGFSIGIAVFPTPPASAEDALAHADALMYQIKQQGKNGLRVRVVDAATAVQVAAAA